MSDLLGGKNPCTIPERDLRRELKRCKRCLVFSGVDVTMQVGCGDRIRMIRMDILDRDLFDHDAKTPEHTSWTMSVLHRLDEAVGKGVMDRPMFSDPTTPMVVNIASAHAKSLDALRLGVFDALFPKAPDKPSELYAESLKPRIEPSVALKGAPELQPVSYSLPKYPPIARLAHVEGEVAVDVTVGDGGTVSSVTVVSGPPLLRKAVEVTAAEWKFPTEAAGRKLGFVVEFKTNCPAVRK